MCQKKAAPREPDVHLSIVASILHKRLNCIRQDAENLDSHPGRSPRYDEVSRLISSLRNIDRANKVAIIRNALKQYVDRVLDRNSVQSLER